MRIAYVCADPGVPVFGRKGCSVHVQEVIGAFRGLGLDVVLFAARFDGDPPPELAGIPLHGLPGLPKGELAAREPAALAANHALGAQLAREGPFDLVYERYSLWSFAGMEHARALGVPALLEVNAPLIEEQAEYRRLADRESAERVAERAYGAATLLVAVSKEVATYLEGYPQARGRVCVVPNGVNVGRFSPGGRHPVPPGRRDAFTVGFVGSLKPWHGLPTLLEALAVLRQRHDDVRLLVVGDGPERASLEAAVAARALREVVQFTGAVAPSEVPALLVSLDVAVAPYPNRPYCYFSPLKVYEYMAAGLPVVASRVGQLVELIQDGVNGLLCPPDDPVALAEAIDRLRSDPRLAGRLGQAARATVLEHHTWDAVVRHVLQVAGCQPAFHPYPLEVRT